ncbi:MAG: O-antigen ligase family protein [Chloroflexi bacterium]|nr:O-antigen ligase family protein [Chloroflexota bacterium]
MNNHLRRVYRLCVQALWILLLVLIPITSFPPLVDRVGGTPVAPLAMVPLAGILIFWMIPALVRGRKLPLLALPFLFFVAIVLLSAAAALTLGILPLRGASVLGRELRAVFTLALGVGFYLTATLLPQDDPDLRRALRFITLGGVLTLLWATVQAGVVMTGGEAVPQAFVNLHRLIAPRDLVPDRLTGMAFEPSWLGDQLVTFYLPLWVGGVLTRTSAWSASRRGWWVEALLSVWGMAALLLTRSRISYLSLAMAVGCLALFGVWQAAGGIQRRWAARGGLAGRVPSWALKGVMVLLFLSLSSAALVSAAWAYSRVDPRMVRLFQTYDRLPEVRAHYPNEVAYEVANRVAFAERVAYWQAGMATFADHPLLGVGLGNAGFFIESNLPGYAFRLTEIKDLRSGAFAGLPNPKNLWVRLLAETGLMGFAAFLTWWVLTGATALVLWRQSTGLLRLLGSAGVLGLIAAVGEGFSLDTFALPHLWILAGLVARASITPEGPSPLAVGPGD